MEPIDHAPAVRYTIPLFRHAAARTFLLLSPDEAATFIAPPGSELTNESRSEKGRPQTILPQKYRMVRLIGFGAPIADCNCASGKFPARRVGGRQIEMDRLCRRVRGFAGKIELLLRPSREVGFVAVLVHCCPLHRPVRDSRCVPFLCVIRPPVPLGFTEKRFKRSFLSHRAVIVARSRANVPLFQATPMENKTVTGSEIARHEWSSTSLGPLDTWPTSLRSTLALMLACPTPMFLAWGPDLLCFYNDAYRPILGYRLDTALGQPFREVWGSIWDEIEPLVKTTLAGESQTLIDMRLDLSRTGLPEESWWTFTYSPVFDDAGEIAGLLCVTGETTPRVIAERERKAADERLDLALSAGNSIGTWDWDVVADRVTADTRFATLYGIDPDEAARGAPLADFFNGIHPDDLERVRSEVAAAVEQCGSFVSEYRLLHSDGSVRWVSAQGRCIAGLDGCCERFPGVSYDITDRMTSELALRAAKAERDFVVELTGRQRVATDPETIIRVAAEALGQRLGAHRAGFYRLHGAKQMRHSESWTDGTLSPLIGFQPVSAFGERAERQRRRGKTLVFSDSRYENDGDLAAYADTGVLAGLCVPLMDAGRWQAGIYLHHADVRHWTPAEISLVKEVAELTWLAVERAEALLRLNQRVDQQSAALAEASTEIRTEVERRSAAESQVRQLQKMESLGQLTGGIAHDFNNMLAIIIGGLNIAQRRLARGEQDVGKYLDGAMEGATRAATLTQRLLAFSRQQPLSPEPIDLNKLVGGLSDLLTRSLGELVQLETILGAGLWKAKADPNELENIIVNMAVNARDAMPEGGRLTIETCNAHVDDDYAREAEIPPGQYVQISVTDTGTGIAPDVLERVFDPFFTTKPTGKGTGLGLSQVFGFARQSGGHVRVYSEIGHGTTFKLYLPRFWGDEVPMPRRKTAPARQGRTSEIVLVVEDEERVRQNTVETLRELGYTVLHAASGPEALGMIEAGQDVTVLLTDIVMPGMTGRQLADRAAGLLPLMKVIYMTGYTRNAVVHNGILDPGTNFLPKPFGIEQLSAKISEVLDG
ncbi:MAG: response regulator [Sphingomonas sp.]|jgi:signal transduction histidine kinase/CheY-like chemotaxis protein/PAS domain-containing protein|uniref:ATP-binding protein n=1 Tax=unclassified Sphingomonas TaxID=196159 RepID=UPI0018DF3685|nr:MULTISPECIES: ATP-binding protein [unclassified Sphingomonas]MCP4025483.1 response regulator [Sphingomonas sp.]